MTVIICPACNTRFETAAVIPPTGRKVRCSKCGNVWQAMAVIEPAKPSVITAPTPPPRPVEPRPAPAMPRPVPAASPPAAAPRPIPAEPRPSSPPLGTPMGRFPGAPAAPATPAPPSFAPRPTNGPAAPAPAAKPSGPLFSSDDMQPDIAGDGSGTTLAGDGTVQDLGSYNAGALVNPDAGLSTNVPIAEGRERKTPPAVAIGWGALALLLILLAAFVAMAPKTVVSLLPGAAPIYAMVGMPVSTTGLRIENVRSAWGDSGGQRVLQVEGDIVNLASGELGVPAVVISLQDPAGKELAQFTTNVLPLASGARSPFSVQIPGAPENVSSLKVGFAKAE